MEGQQQASGTDTDPRRTACDCSQHWKNRRTVAVVPEVVLSQPKAVVAQILCPCCVIYDFLVHASPRSWVDSWTLHAVQPIPEFHCAPVEDSGSWDPGSWITIAEDLLPETRRVTPDPLRSRARHGPRRRRSVCT